MCDVVDKSGDEMTPISQTKYVDVDDVVVSAAGHAATPLRCAARGVV